MIFIIDLESLANDPTFWPTLAGENLIWINDLNSWIRLLVNTGPGDPRACLIMPNLDQVLGDYNALLWAMFW